MKTFYLFLLMIASTHAATDTLLNPVIYARTPNQIQITLGASCSPCSLYWQALDQGGKLISEVYGIAGQTVKVQYDFQGFNSTRNNLILSQAGKYRSTMPFTMDYPIPESIARRPKASAVKYHPRYLVNGRIPRGQAGRMVLK
jgi:hypothetical protein